jgi:hypothetical protein
MRVPARVCAVSLDAHHPARPRILSRILSLLKAYAGRACAGHHDGSPTLGSAQGAAEVGRRRSRAATASRGELEHTEAFLSAAPVVEVVVMRPAGLRRGGE